MTQPLVYIVIPVFNREKTLALSVKSILNQTYENWDLMIVDDHSTDRSPEIIEELMAGDNRIRTKSNTEYSHSAAGARLSGLKERTGRYIAFLDSDDTWPEYHLEEFVEYLESNSEVDFVFGDLKRVNQLGDTVVESKFRDEKGLPEDLSINWKGFWGEVDLKDSVQIAIKHRFCTGVHTAVCKSDFFEKVSLRDVYGCEDALLTIESLYKGMRLVACNKIHLNYLIHDDNVSSVGASMSLEHSEKNALAEVNFYDSLIPKYIKLSECEDNERKKKLADLYVWHLAYSTYTKFGRYQDSLFYIKKAIKINPTNISYYKTYISTLLKKVFLSK